MILPVPPNDLMTHATPDMTAAFFYSPSRLRRNILMPETPTQPTPSPAHAHATPGTPDVVVEIHGGRLDLAASLRELWGRRDLLHLLIWKSVSGAHRQMALGALWIILQPIFQMVVFTLVFGTVLKVDSEGIPYPLFLFSALLPWQLFAESAKASTQSLLANLDLITKVYFPRILVPLTAVTGRLVYFLPNLLILFVLALAYGYPVPWTLLLMPAYILGAAAAGLAVGLWLSCLSVRFRDVSHVIGYALSLFMYATPVIYPSNAVPDRWQALYRLNPLVTLIDGFRGSFLGTPKPGLDVHLVTGGILLVLLVSGAVIFQRSQRTIVDLR